MIQIMNHVINSITLKQSDLLLWAVSERHTGTAITQLRSFSDNDSVPPKQAPVNLFLL
jgi:hypothetical protein